MEFARWIHLGSFQLSRAGSRIRIENSIIPLNTSVSGITITVQDSKKNFPFSQVKVWLKDQYVFSRSSAGLQDAFVKKKCSWVLLILHLLVCKNTCTELLQQRTTATCFPVFLWLFYESFQHYDEGYKNLGEAFRQLSKQSFGQFATTLIFQSFYDVSEPSCAW